VFETASVHAAQALASWAASRSGVRKGTGGFPSSKTCSGCGTVKTDLTLGERTYACEACGQVIDHDANAAVNLARYQSPTTVSPPRPVAA
jgi:transposase